MTEKVLPTFLVGDPPSYSRIVEAQRNAPPVGWRLSIGERSIGWALSDTKLLPSGLTDIYGLVHFDALPLEEIMPGWLKAVSRLIAQPINRQQMDARSVLTIDALGHLVRFDSTVHVDPLDETLRIHGTVEGRQLQLTLRSGNASFASEAFLPSDALPSDVLSPQTQLPGLRVGQEWKAPVYSPLWPAKNPLEIIRAKVEKLEPILWNGAIENCWCVVYRNDSGVGDAREASPRGTLWVRRDGAVLRQQIVLFDSTIRFDRLSDEDAAALADAAGPRWWSAEDELWNEPPQRRIMENDPRDDAHD